MIDCDPDTPKVPKLGQVVPAPCCGVQDVVFDEFQDRVTAEPGVTVEELVEKLLMVATWAAGPEQEFRLAACERTITLPVAGSMLTALMEVEALSAMAGTLSSDSVWACTAEVVIRAGVIATNANANTLRLERSDCRTDINRDMG